MYPQSQVQNRFISTKEAGEILHRTPQTIRKYMREGKIRYQRNGDTKAHPGRGSYQLLQSDVMKLKEPEFITARMIAKHMPCDEQFKEFKRLFPNGVETTEEALKKVAEAGLNAWWLVKKFELTVKIYWFYPNGSIKWEEHYRNGKLNDPSPDIPAIKGFYPNGSIKWEVHYLNGEFISQKYYPKE